jgi:hypothetical protein
MSPGPSMTWLSATVMKLWIESAVGYQGAALARFPPHAQPRRVHLASAQEASVTQGPGLPNGSGCKRLRQRRHQSVDRHFCPARVARNEALGLLTLRVSRAL